LIQHGAQIRAARFKALNFITFVLFGLNINSFVKMILFANGEGLIQAFSAVVLQHFRGFYGLTLWGYCRNFLFIFVGLSF